MKNLHSSIRLTDELERQLIQQAIEQEHFRFKSGPALAKLFAKIGGMFKSNSASRRVTSESAA